MFDSAPSQARGLDLEHFRYETTEYFVSGTAAGKPYTTRVVVRQPADDDEFSGLVLAESMHGSGAAHMFEFTSGLLDGLGPRGRRDRHDVAAAVRRIQRGALRAA